MGCDVYANGDEIACKAGDAKVIAAFPDVCLTPPPPPAGPIPVPYPNTSMSSDMQSGSKSVQIKGQEVMLKDSSFYQTNPLGDEAATNGQGAGVMTATITGKTYFVAWSMDVQFEGQNVDRHTDLTTSNHASPTANAPAPMPAQGGAASATKCPPHSWKRLADKDTTEDRIKDLETKGAAGDVGSAYNACVARKYQAQGKKVDVSLRFKCDCGEYQEADLEVDGQLKETKAGNQGAKKKQTLNYIDVSKALFSGAPVQVLCQSATKAASEAPHVGKWGAEVIHEACP